MVSEHESGYMCGFSVYTGENSTKLVGLNATLDLCCTVTTKTVMGLLESTKMLDQHRIIFFDNNFLSAELCEELLYRDSYACGMARPHHKGSTESSNRKENKIEERGSS